MSLSLAPPRRSISFIDSAVKVSVIMDGCRAQGCQIGSDFPAQFGNTSRYQARVLPRGPGYRVARLAQISPPNLATHQVSARVLPCGPGTGLPDWVRFPSPIWQHSRYQARVLPQCPGTALPDWVRFPAQSGNTAGISQGPTLRSWNRVARLGLQLGLPDWVGKSHPIWQPWLH